MDLWKSLCCKVPTLGLSLKCLSVSFILFFFFFQNKKKITISHKNQTNDKHMHSSNGNDNDNDNNNGDENKSKHKGKDKARLKEEMEEKEQCQVCGLGNISDRTRQEDSCVVIENCTFEAEDQLVHVEINRQASDVCERRIWSHYKGRVLLAISITRLNKHYLQEFRSGNRQRANRNFGHTNERYILPTTFCRRCNC
ncbi:hypothetical protein RFI_31045 [Reticulomyxa filosa]|uniref:Uncharacterized protein n=1 Tax=Reticulomyxa filosa TaxID=46433 RepID=X6LYC2_RETFI|nr:hypothetical protein RFI_31045 [Reticulomyxa filosa]|eukprot:ETO06351.1 hypothetical protein RFI_31045 [Reticulomyxa filosa]